MNGIRAEETSKMNVEFGCRSGRLNAMKILDEFYRELWENDCEIMEDAEFLI